MIVHVERFDAQSAAAVVKCADGMRTERRPMAMCQAPVSDACPRCDLADMVPVKAKLVCPNCHYVQGCCDPA